MLKQEYAQHIAEMSQRVRCEEWAELEKNKEDFFETGNTWALSWLGHLTVLDNVKVGLHNQVKYTTATGILRLPSYFVKERAMNEKAMELLKIFDLDGEAGQPASSLPYGKQRKLEIARALATDPKLLLLDEPAAGMNPNETAELMETVRFVRDKFDIAVLLIEHDMSFVMGLCEHITVLDYGRIIAEGDPETVRSDPKVIAAYLGGEA